MNQNDFSLALHSDDIISLPGYRALCGAAKAAPRFIAAGIAAMLMLTAKTTLAGSATWKLNPASSDWNMANNWTPMTVPNGDSDIATFGFSNTTAVSFSTNTDVGEIVFNAGASAYTVTVPVFAVSIWGAGITNTSGIAQNFIILGDDGNGGTEGVIIFNSGNAGSSTVFTNMGGMAHSAFGGQTFFQNTSNAGNGNFTNNGGVVSGAYPGVIQFLTDSTAGNGTFTNNGGAASSALGGATVFEGNSTAANGMFINQGGTVSGAIGGTTQFSYDSTAGNATLIANGGSGGGEGGTIVFDGYATGGTARVKVFGNGILSMISGINLSVMIGSIEGDGNVDIGGGGHVLTVGNNNLSTIFSGVIYDSGSLTKTGTGTLRLSGANIYTGGTVIDAGRLLANNSSGSATGTDVVSVNNGGSVLGGTGTISGPVTVSSNAAVLGGNATVASGALKIGNNLSLNAGAIIQLVLGPSGTHSSLTRTGGTWSFASSQKFTFLDLGAQPGVYNNIITGLASNPGGMASWTITNAGFTGTFSYDGAGNIDLNLTAAAGPALQLSSAVSRKTHTGAGTFDINLPLTGEPGVECRSSGGNHTLRFTFTNNVVSGNASVTSGTGVTGTPTFGGTVMTVNLTGVADVQKITVTLSNVTDSLNQVLPDKAVSVNMLRGDTTGNKTVNSSDIGQTKSRSGQAASASNFRSDVTVSGTINASDIGLVKSRSGSGVP